MSKQVTCPECQGGGWYQRPPQEQALGDTQPAHDYTKYDCPTCHGKGTVPPATPPAPVEEQPDFPTITHKKVDGVDGYHGADVLVEDTHSSCNARLQTMGAEAECCTCAPHEGCELVSVEEAQTTEPLVMAYPLAGLRLQLATVITNNHIGVGVVTDADMDRIMRMIEQWFGVQNTLSPQQPDTPEHVNISPKYTRPIHEPAQPIGDELKLREQLAAVEHERWADWQKYVHGVCQVNPGSKELVIPVWAVDNWTRQTNTPYDKLSPAEQKSDMEQVDRYWPLMEAWNARQNRAYAVKVLQRLMRWYLEAKIQPYAGSLADEIRLAIKEQEEKLK